MKAIIAIGSPFGADQAAWEELERLQSEPAIRAQAEAGELQLIRLDRPGMALLEQMQGFTEVTLIDALLTDQYAPGRVVELTPDELDSLPQPASSHGIGVAEALAMGKVLGMLPAQLTVLGVVVADKTGLSSLTNR